MFALATELSMHASSLAIPADGGPVAQDELRDWKDHDAYQQTFGRLLRDLKAVRV